LLILVAFPTFSQSESSQYINQIRFQEARRMLEEKEYFPVKSVAYSVGFKPENNFII
jgi:AraC-like DNA-binding protein